MQRLLYSAIYGLKEVDRLPESIAPGAYMRNDLGTWSRFIINKSSVSGNKVYWVQINKRDLPKELRLEALILNINL